MYRFLFRFLKFNIHSNNFSIMYSCSYNYILSLDSWFLSWIIMISFVIFSPFMLIISLTGWICSGWGRSIWRRNCCTSGRRCRWWWQFTAATHSKWWSDFKHWWTFSKFKPTLSSNGKQYSTKPSWKAPIICGKLDLGKFHKFLQELFYETLQMLVISAYLEFFSSATLIISFYKLWISMLLTYYDFILSIFILYTEFALLH